VLPINLRISVLYALIDAARGLRNDLKNPHDRVLPHAVREKLFLWDALGVLAEAAHRVVNI
jgi:hypothetical protein